ncbi:MAG TPA: hypothetical protein VF834_07265 [Streptosporangiaceae bacterium]
MRRLRIRLLISPLVVGAALLAVPAAQASTLPHAVQAGRIGTGVPASKAAGSVNAVLNGVSCLSTTSCVSVGWYKNGTVYSGLSEILAGTAWSLATVATPTRNNFVTFPGEVSCASATNCMLVGEHYTRTPTLLAERWNGSAWTIAASSSPIGANSSWLGDVACPGPTFCMTVGQETLTSGKKRAIARQWNGSSWGPIAVPAPAHARTSELGGLACTTTTRCMAVGDYQKSGPQLLTYAASWNGSTWKILPAASASGEARTIFNAVACPTATQCVAVGYSAGPGTHPIVETLSNGAFHFVATPRRTLKSGLASVTCADTSHCITVGWSGTKSLIEAWSGHGWVVQTAPATGTVTSSNVLLHVSCVSATHCVAVGARANPNSPSTTNHTLIEVFNGSKWTIQNSLNP